MASPDISVVITAHREGVIAGATARSALAALSATGSAGLSHEIIVVLDRADAATGEVLRQGLEGQAQFLETSEGDPGQARNRGIEVANGLCAAFLDADDLWSENWLTEAWKMIETRPDAAAHSACNIVFGRARRVWWHTDSEAALCDHAYLSWLNYWDAMTFARTELYRRFPFRRNDLALKFGHEDWHWNMWTLSQGVAHKPVPRTVHFKRARAGSQMAKVEGVGAVPWPLAITPTPAAPVAGVRSCVFCGSDVEAWKPYRGGISARSPFVARVGAIGSNPDRFACPSCGSTDRERHLHLFFHRLRIWPTLRGASVLHMAPEPQLAKAIAAWEPSTYIRGDLFPSDPSVKKINIEKMSFIDRSFDFVICNHILEHVSQPTAALGEVHRVLKPGGRFVCQTPFASRLAKSFEDPLLETPVDRSFFYGQEDHVRLFGLDVEQIIANAGFIGRLTPHGELLPDVDPEAVGVNEHEPFFDFVRA